MEEALARSIWNNINQGKTGTKLERLRLWTMGGSESGVVTVSHADGTIVKNLSRSWLIERDPRDDSNDFTIREIGKHMRESGDKLIESELTKSAAGQVFRTIWSRREGSEDWRDDWSSFPLMNSKFDLRSDTFISYLFQSNDFWFSESAIVSARAVK